MRARAGDLPAQIQAPAEQVLLVGALTAAGHLSVLRAAAGAPSSRKVVSGRLVGRTIPDWVHWLMLSGASRSISAGRWHSM